MKVASVVHNHFTHDSRVEKQAVSLTNAGYDLTVFSLWKIGLLQDERKENYIVKRTKIFSSFMKGPLGRLINFIEFSLKISWRIRQVDIIHCHDYHPLPAVLMTKLFMQSKSLVIYDAHEYQSQKLGLNWLSRFSIKSLEKISSFFIDGFITVSGSILQTYESLFSKIPKTLIFNCPATEESKESDKFDSLTHKDSIKFLYQGGLIPCRGIEELIEGFCYQEFKDINLILMGHGGMTSAGKNLEKHIVELSEKHKNIHFVESVPRNELLSYTSSASIGVCLTIDNCLNHRYSLPNKFFEYAMAGLPILVSDLPEMHTLVEKYECGIVCESVTPDEIIKGVRKLLSMDLKKLGTNARNMAKDYSWEVQEKKLFSLYDEVVEKKSR